MVESVYFVRQRGLSPALRLCAREDSGTVQREGAFGGIEIESVPDLPIFHAERLDRIFLSIIAKPCLHCLQNHPVVR